MNCQNCTHYHDQGGNILCDAGIMEVILIGGPKVKVRMPDCKSYESIEPYFRVSYGYEGCDKPESIEVKVESDNPIEQAIIEAKKRGRPAKA